MKKLALYTGGHNFRIDDLLHMQTGTIESLMALGRAVRKLFGVNEICLDGFSTNLTGSSLFWTQGWFFANDEIFFLPGGSLSTTSSFNPNYLYARVKETYAPPSPVTYQNASVHNVHIVRELEIVYNPSPILPGDFPVSTIKRVENLKTLIDDLDNRLSAIESGWIEWTKSGTFATGEIRYTYYKSKDGSIPGTQTDDWLANATLKVRWKIIGKTAHITFWGRLYTGSSPSIADSSFGRTREVLFAMPQVEFGKTFASSNTPFVGSGTMGNHNNPDKFPAIVTAIPTTSNIQIKLCYIPKNMTYLGNTDTYIFFEDPNTNSTQHIYFTGSITAEVA
jgi:hypothetical protein